jgi:putative ABC transport system ATP-binding protein
MAAAVSLPPVGPASPAESLIELRHVSKDYDTGGGIVRAMREVSMTIAHGEFVAIVGASGSGKSTMMNILGCLDRPTRGSYTLAGVDVGVRAGDSRAIVRNRVIGFIFQGFNLLPRTTALENTELPLQYRGVGGRARRKRARAALEAVGLGDRLDHTPNQLSGGQQQRVAIARALVTDPPLLLADEPTGNLDTRTSLEVLALLQRLNRDRGITIVLVTHERDIAACAGRVITMRDGRIVTDIVQSEPMDAAVELAKLPPADDGSGDGPASLRGEDHAESPAMRLGGPVPLGVYPMMLLGGLAGAIAAYAYLAFLLGAGNIGKAVLAVPVVSEIARAWVGTRWARRKLARPATRDQLARIALTYTIAVTCVLGALVVAVVLFWWSGSPSIQGVLERGAPLATRGAAVVAAVALVLLAGTGLLRYLLLTLLNPSPRRAAKRR